MNKNTFSTTPTTGKTARTRAKAVPRAVVPTNTVNASQSPAYDLGAKHTLAQMATTGCFNQTYYVGAKEQVSEVIRLSKQVEPLFLAQVAVYSRTRGYMKDMPALLLALLATRDPQLFLRTFPLVVTNEKMLKNFITILRSGVTGRKSCNYTVKKAVNTWLTTRDPNRLFTGDVGSTPSLADIIHLSHPRTEEGSAHEALFKYLLGKEYNFDRLPLKVREFEQYKKTKKGEVPDLPFQLLTSMDLGTEEWKTIAKNAPWHMLRMNLNTFERHGVFGDAAMVGVVATKLADEDAIKKAKVFPYQLLTTHKAISGLPAKIMNGLEKAMEVASANIPEIEGTVVICPDVSGSMRSPVTGTREGATSKTQCVDVAALVAVAMARRNAKSRILPFENRVVENAGVSPNARILEAASQLSRIGGGGTNCSAPLKKLADEKAKVDLVVFVSDNESWVDATGGRRGETATLTEWRKIKAQNPNAKMVCIDLTPHGTVQAPNSSDILNIGGFSDTVFEIMGLFMNNQLSSNYWVGEIEKTEIP